MSDATPQQQLFLKYYLDPKSETFSNYLQTGLRVGFSQQYSESIGALMPDWLADGLGKARRGKLVEKAERNLDLALEGLLDDPEKGGRPLQYKASEFTLTRLNKEQYSERKEITGKDGKDLPQPIINVSRDISPQEDQTTQEEN